MTEEKTKQKKAARRGSGGRILPAVSAVLSVVMLCAMLVNMGTGTARSAAPGGMVSVSDIPGKQDQMVASQEALFLASCVEGGGNAELLRPRQVLTLDDNDLIAPRPNPSGFGEVTSAKELAWLPEKAAALLDGQELYFGPERQLKPDAPIKYYLDDTIAVITWKEIVGVTVVTFAEVKIADGSQFRRFLAGGQFGNDTQYHTTEMAQTVNAVLASSGDFYKFRYNGVVVYGNTVRRVNTNKADTCYIDVNGDLSFTYQNNTMTQEEAQAYVDAHDIRFSLTFGPILVDNGERCEPDNYDLGEVNSFSPRAALCQMDKLHYLVVTSNAEDDYPGALNMHQFAERIAATGCQKAYALDGGQTAAIALNGELVNRVLYGQQRPISDIIYFATAIPDGG